MTYAYPPTLEFSGQYQQSAIVVMLLPNPDELEVCCSWSNAASSYLPNVLHLWCCELYPKSGRQPELNSGI